MDLLGDVSVSWVWSVPTLLPQVFCSSAVPKLMMTGYWTSLSSSTVHETGPGMSYPDIKADSRTHLTSSCCWFFMAIRTWSRNTQPARWIVAILSFNCGSPMGAVEEVGCKRPWRDRA